MKTQIFRENQTKQAAQLIKQGDLVAFPTETVYGLGADTFNQKAIKKIFIAKGRPQDNPLIVHIAELKQLNELIKIQKDKIPLVKKITKHFWPGPLTLIFKKTDKIPKEVTGGLNTVAVRMPNNIIALNLIKQAQVPIAAPSANISGKPSGTKYAHIVEDFNNKIKGIIKSKQCEIGLESTVIDLSIKTPTLLRPGGISFEQLKKVIPNIVIYKKTNNKKVKSPGMKYKHYSPKAKVMLFEDKNKIVQYKNKLKNKKIRIVKNKNTDYLSKHLFAIFRQADLKKVDYIFIETVEEKGLGLALMNRLKKAAHKIIK